MVTRYLTVQTVPVPFTGKLGEVIATPKADPYDQVQWRTQCSNGRGGVFSVPERSWVPGFPLGVVQEVDRDGSVLGSFNTGLGGYKLLAPFTGSCSGLVVYERCTGEVRVLASPNTIAWSHMSGTRVAWMATVARAIQRRFRVPPSAETRAPCVVQ